MTFTELVNEVSARTGLTKKDTAAAIKAVQSVVRDALAKGGRVKFPNFGVFYRADLAVRSVVRFRETRRKTMEKYAVVLDDEKTKLASKGCPRCGGKLDESGACPKHGFEPFEKKPVEPKK